MYNICMLIRGTTIHKSLQNREIRVRSSSKRLQFSLENIFIDNFEYIFLLSFKPSLQYVRYNKVFLVLENIL